MDIKLAGCDSSKIAILPLAWNRQYDFYITYLCYFALRDSPFSQKKRTYIIAQLNSHMDREYLQEAKAAIDCQFL